MPSKRPTTTPEHPPHSRLHNRQGFYLDKRPNKHFGFLYYVRYWHNGKRLPSKWCTHTNILSKAEAFARDNRERIISSYLKQREIGKSTRGPYSLSPNSLFVWRLNSLTTDWGPRKEAKLYSRLSALLDQIEAEETLKKHPK